MNRLPPHYVEVERVYARTVGQGSRSIAITAAESGEGVTTLCRALAQRSALGGSRTLLVNLKAADDQDTNVSGQRVADSDEPPDQVRWEESHSDGYTIVAAPGCWHESLSLRETGSLAEHMRDWLERFDVVIFDAPPLGSRTHHTVPAEKICASCEATILVVLACRTPTNSIAMAMERLDGVGVTLAGTVLNDRFNPTLADEMMRETCRLDRWLPRLATGMRSAIRRSRILMLDN